MDNIEPKAGDVLVDKMGNRYIVLENNNKKLKITREGTKEPFHEDTWDNLQKLYNIEQKAIEQKAGKKNRYRRHKMTHRRHKKTHRRHKKTHRRHKKTHRL